MAPRLSDRNTMPDFSDCDRDPSSALTELRTLLSQNTVTQVHSFDDAFLIKFLRSRCYDVAKTQQLLVWYLEKISERPDLFQWDDSIKDAIEARVFNLYQHPTPSGQRLLLIHPGKWNPSQVDILQLIKLSIIGEEINLLDETAQKEGYVTVINMSGLGLTQVYKCGLFNARLISDLTDRCMPIRIVNIHVVFENRLTDIAYSLFKPFLEEELRNKIVFHGRDLESLHRYVPSSCLPPIFGGTNEDPNPDAIWKRLLPYRERIENMWNSIKSKLKQKQ
ncbi:alpha-tocopherol transfer protein-like [Brevipalpus obovatus]|uniref:alpha-tocopherol transfer protein-like n=1 Tax=Brevipalpus obovatus TaxID=246614 RepID=UPI003D9F72E1